MYCTAIALYYLCPVLPLRAPSWVLAMLPDLQKGLPVEDKYKAESPGTNSDLNACSLTKIAISGQISSSSNSNLGSGAPRVFTGSDSYSLPTWLAGLTQILPLLIAKRRVAKFKLRFRWLMFGSPDF